MYQPNIQSSARAKQEKVIAYMRYLSHAFNPELWLHGPKRQFAVLALANDIGSVASLRNVADIGSYSYEDIAFFTNPGTHAQNPPHTERTVLSELSILWDRSTLHNKRSPSDVLLFTYNSPCSRYLDHDCVDAIIEFSKFRPFSSAAWHVGYSRRFWPSLYSDQEAGVKLNGARKMLQSEGIDLVYVPDEPDQGLPGRQPFLRPPTHAVASLLRTEHNDMLMITRSSAPTLPIKLPIAGYPHLQQQVTVFTGSSHLFPVHTFPIPVLKTPVVGAPYQPSPLFAESATGPSIITAPVNSSPPTSQPSTYTTTHDDRRLPYGNLVI